MSAREADRLTNNSDETFAKSIFGGSSYFIVPIFQRPYKWNVKNRLPKFVEDLKNIIDKEETHFLGAVIFSEQHTNPSQPSQFDVIDGQQRLTTIYLLICAAVKLLFLHGKEADAQNYLKRFLVHDQKSTNGSNIRLQPSLSDRAQMNKVLFEIFDNKRLKTHLEGIKLRPLSEPSDSTTKGRIIENYRYFERWFKDQIKTEGSIDVVQNILDYTLSYLSLVQIVVKDPTAGPTIFDSLNSKQEPMTTGELVKNGIFSRASHLEADEIEALEKHSWQPFYEGFSINNISFFDRYFFPFGLTKNSNVRKENTFSFLQKSWSNFKEPNAIIKDLSRHQAAFMDLQCGTNRLTFPNKELSLRINRVFQMSAPASIMPFMLQLLESVEAEKLTQASATEAIDCIESFLIRRAVCGIEPTGLHAVFKRLWADVGGNFSKNIVTDTIKSHKTVQWPDNKQFRENLLERDLYGVGVCNFLLTQYDSSLGGDKSPKKGTIEHILPQTMSSYWSTIFSKDDHKKYKDRLGNLVLLSEEGQNKVSNYDFSTKLREYKNNSIYKSTREFSSIYSEWSPKEIESRATIMADWALTRWQY